MTPQERQWVEAIAAKSEADSEVVQALSTLVLQLQAKQATYASAFEAIERVLDAHSKVIESHAQYRDSQVFALMERVSSLEAKLGSSEDGR